MQNRTEEQQERADDAIRRENSSAMHDSSWSPVMLDKVCQLRGEGYSWPEIAEAIGVNKDTLNEWRNNDRTFYALTENAWRRFQKKELLDGVHRVHA